MHQFQAVLLDVWQEACRHIEIGQSTKTITDRLSRLMPIEQVLVRRIDRRRRSIETVAAESPGSGAEKGTRFNLREAGPLGQIKPGSFFGPVHTECSAAELDTLLAWCKRGEVARRGKPGAPTDVLPLIVPADVRGDVLAGPLGDPRCLAGVLVLIAPSGQTFDARHVALTQVLLDPFSAALENDHRLREMATLREAAEADKRSLLSRLGRKKLGDMTVGADTGLRSVMERAELVAGSDVPVLIFGETGTGKELLARAIHAQSARASGPINRVNCGAIPPELIDSQLFGHEKGAFTGAIETRKGWFERADGGTLFLDEIGELPLAAQVRLLRILQDGWLERVGGQHRVKVDVRIVAATHRNLAGMVAQGKFREDLWYRIAVFPIMLPPLRDRMEDIPALATHFAARAATRFGLPPMTLSPEDIGLLSSYSWPGNIRELATVIDRAAILGDGRGLEVAKALGVTAGSSHSVPQSSKQRAEKGDVPTEIISLDAAISRHIKAVLAVTKGRIEGLQGAAVLLEVNPHTLRARMRKLGIDWKQFREKPV